MGNTTSSQFSIFDNFIAYNTLSIVRMRYVVLIGVFQFCLGIFGSRLKSGGVHFMTLPSCSSSSIRWEWTISHCVVARIFYTFSSSVHPIISSLITPIFPWNYSSFLCHASSSLSYRFGYWHIFDQYQSQQYCCVKQILLSKRRLFAR